MYAKKMNDDASELDEVTVVFRRHYLPQDVFNVMNEDNLENRHNLWLSERGESRGVFVL
jgi:hypothetical protein